MDNSFVEYCQRTEWIQIEPIEYKSNRMNANRSDWIQIDPIELIAYKSIRMNKIEPIDYKSIRMNTYLTVCIQIEPNQ